MGWEGECLERREKPGHQPFSPNKITRRTVNTRPRNELTWSVVTTQGMLAEMENCQVPPAEQSSKVQCPVCSHPAYLLNTAAIQVSFQALEIPDPPCHPPLHLGECLLYRVGGFIIQLLVKHNTEFQTPLCELQRPFSPVQPQRKSKAEKCLARECLDEEAPGPAFHREVELMDDLGLCWSEKGEFCTCSACRAHAASCHPQKNQPSMAQKASCLKPGCTVIQDSLTKRSHELPLSSILTQICHCKQNCQVFHLRSPHQPWLEN